MTHVVREFTLNSRACRPHHPFQNMCSNCIVLPKYGINTEVEPFEFNGNQGLKYLLHKKHEWRRITILTINMFIVLYDHLTTREKD